MIVSIGINNNSYSNVIKENIYIYVQQNIVKKFNLKTFFFSKEFRQIEGTWEITSFIDKGIESHSDDIYINEVNINWEEYRLEREKNIGMQIKINKNTIESFLPAGESEVGYIVSNYENMFFGYKPPIDMLVTYPILRICIVHRDFKYPIYFIFDSMDKGVIDILGDFYYLERVN